MKLLALLAVMALSAVGCTPYAPLRHEASLTETGRVFSLTTPPPNCPHLPLGGFAEVWRDERVWPRLGCALAPADPITGTEACLCCVHSLWLREKNFFVAVQDSGLRWSFVPDGSSLPPDAPLMMEPALRGEACFAATGRHGWLASSPMWAQRCNGLSQTGEKEFAGSVQQFEGGWLLWNGEVCFVLYSDGNWTMF